MKVPTLDAPDTVSAALAAELERLNIEHGMITGRPWIDPAPVVGEPLIPFLIRLAFTDQAMARSIAEREGFDGTAFVELFRSVEESTRAGRPFLVSAIAKVGETVAENPALLFAAPFAVAALTGAFGAAGATGASVSAAESAVAATAPVSVSAEVAAAEAAAASTAAVKAQALIPKIVGGINSARTIAAVANGEAPPPPLSIEGDSFLEWGTSLGMNVLQSELAKRGERLSREEAAQAELEMRRAIEEYQRRMLAAGVTGGNPRAVGVSEEAIRVAQTATDSNRALWAAGIVAVSALLALISR